MSVLSDRLRELRGSSSQKEMADELNMKQPQWARYESGASVPGADIIEKICRVHACSADWLLGLKDNGGVNIKAGDGAAVAIGSHAKATSNSKLSTPASLTPNCSKCAYLKKLKKLESILGKQS
jgi:transcriptional regulator with XRE-family HTH domain